MTFRPPPGHLGRMAFSLSPLSRRLIPQLPVQAAHCGVRGGRDRRSVAADDARDCQRAQAGPARETGSGMANRDQRPQAAPGSGGIPSRRSVGHHDRGDGEHALSRGSANTLSGAIPAGWARTSSRCTVIGLTPAARAIV